jgi:hypothetical protein|tara:strand:- start:2046 stop:2156 length:111 start_codon:yes stop_codon:yes gene_type:complete
MSILKSGLITLIKEGMIAAHLLMAAGFRQKKAPTGT